MRRIRLSDGDPLKVCPSCWPAIDPVTLRKLLRTCVPHLPDDLRSRVQDTLHAASELDKRE